MSKPDRPLIPPPDDPGEAWRDLALGLLGFPTLSAVGVLFMMPAVGLLYIGASKILSGEINISLSGSLYVIVALVMALVMSWGGVEMIREDSRRRGW